MPGNKRGKFSEFVFQKRKRGSPTHQEKGIKSARKEIVPKDHWELNGNGLRGERQKNRKGRKELCPPKWGKTALAGK